MSREITVRCLCVNCGKICTYFIFSQRDKNMRLPDIAWSENSKTRERDVSLQWLADVLIIWKTRRIIVISTLYSHCLGCPIQHFTMHRHSIPTAENSIGSSRDSLLVRYDLSFAFRSIFALATLLSLFNLCIGATVKWTIITVVTLLHWPYRDFTDRNIASEICTNYIISLSYSISCKLMIFIYLWSNTEISKIRKYLSAYPFIGLDICSASLSFGIIRYREHISFYANRMCGDKFI